MPNFIGDPDVLGRAGVRARWSRLEVSSKAAVVLPDSAAGVVESSVGGMLGKVNLYPIIRWTL